ncbi:PREDICTED: rap guanine nucleotide exchange factor 3 [Pygoscelis adeliae]|uniref:rap guanine nucleotide exchange factor 3 n=1 Tax=Pygoscelis adeliae TaxID=9238 RepID=UPI0004F4E839|nr:PREDICTED: rap guanine nucleotide exchange factor 3 [Pygoscelis adeliae]
MAEPPWPPTPFFSVFQTPLLDTESTLDYGHSLTQASSEKIWRAGKLLFIHLTSTRPGLIRDHKHHLRHHRQCCSGKELVDWLVGRGVCTSGRGGERGNRQPFTPLTPPRPAQRTEDELELIFEELLHIKAVAHLSNSVKRELASVLMFESHQRAGTVPVPAALAAHAACPPASSAALWLPLEESAGTTVSPEGYLVMAGTPEKILEHLLEFMRLDATLYDPVGCNLASPFRGVQEQKVARNEHGHRGGRPQASATQGTVPYEIYRPDHSCLIAVLPVNASVRDILRSLAPRLGRDGEHVLVKVNSAGDKVGLQLDAVGVFTALGLNERLFAVSVEELGSLHIGSSETLDLISSKDLASHLTDYDWNLFKSIHQVEMIHYIVGPQKFHDVTTANLERVMRRFNELQYWVATELCLCPEVGRRAQLLRKFIKLAAHLKEQKNLNSFFAVMFGVSNTAVSRLAKTWERLPHKIRKLHSALERHMMAKTVRVLQRCRGDAHAPLSPLRNRSPHRPEDPKGVRISTCSEQSLSVRSPVSTWAYLQHLKAIDSQKELLRLSHDLES